eukprot:scaffold11603_cov107-Isochrysis_galbana.AAC.3
MPLHQAETADGDGPAGGEPAYGGVMTRERGASLHDARAVYAPFVMILSHLTDSSRKQILSGPRVKVSERDRQRGRQRDGTSPLGKHVYPHTTNGLPMLDGIITASTHNV